MDGRAATVAATEQGREGVSNQELILTGKYFLPSWFSTEIVCVH
jgi:hypothetical protein